MIIESYPLSVAGDPVANEDNLLTNVEPGIDMPASSVKYLIVHCSATRENRDYTAEQLKRDHLARGFIDVGYHYYIRRDGTVTSHRRLNEVGAHCRPFNRCSIGVCYEGGLDSQGRPKDTRTLKQRSALVRLLTDIMDKILTSNHCQNTFNNRCHVIVFIFGKPSSENHVRLVVCQCLITGVYLHITVVVNRIIWFQSLMPLLRIFL